MSRQSVRSVQRSDLRSARTRSLCLPLTRVALSRILAPALWLIISRPERTNLSPCTPAQVGFSAERLTRVRALIQRYIDEDKLPGVIATIARRGQTVAYQALVE